MRLNLITGLLRQKKLIPAHPSLLPEQTARAIAIEFACLDHDCFLYREKERSRYKYAIRELAETRPVYEYVADGKLPDRGVRIKRVRKLLKTSPEHIVQAFNGSNLSIEDVADAFEHISQDECQTSHRVFWREVLDPPYYPLYFVPQVEVDTNSAEPYTAAQALYVLTEQLARRGHDAEQEYHQMQHYLDMGRWCFRDDELAAYKRKLYQALRIRERFILWHRALRYGAPWQAWSNMFAEQQIVLDFMAGDKRLADLRSRDLLDALVLSHQGEESTDKQKSENDKAPTLN